jgi:hypothetical protein
MNVDHLLNNKAFENIEQERLEAIKSIVQEVKGKTSQEAMFIIMKYARPLRSGRKITKEEGDAMMSVIYEGLTPEEQEQFKGIIQVIEKFV